MKVNKFSVFILMLLLALMFVFEMFCDISSIFLDVYYWGAYILLIPIASSVMGIFSIKSIRNNFIKNCFLPVFVGVVITLLLNRHNNDSFLLGKIVATSVGGIIYWGICRFIFVRKFKHNKNGI